jgi:hypothetical protein
MQIAFEHEKTEFKNKKMLDIASAIRALVDLGIHTVPDDELSSFQYFMTEQLSEVRMEKHRRFRGERLNIKVKETRVQLSKDYLSLRGFLESPLYRRRLIHVTSIAKHS